MAIGTITRGDDYVLKVSFTEEGSDFNIAGDKIFWTVKTAKTLPDNQATYQKIEVISSSTDATAGIHRIQIPNTLPVGTLYYDVQLRRDTSGGGGLVTVENQSFTVTQDVTIAQS